MGKGPANTQKRGVRTILAMAVGVIIFLSVVTVAMERTSTTGYCTSCHEMAPYKEELKLSSHAVDKEKNPVECRDCHIPNSFGGRYVVIKTVLGMRDMAVHYFGDPDNLDRRAMQGAARRFIPDENCLECHQDLKKDTEGNPLSEIGVLCHEAYLGENGQTRSGCAGCHSNLAHLPEFDRRYDFNADFAKRFPLAEENMQ